MSKQCKKFYGLIYYLLICLRSLQKRLIPICSLTRKYIPFQWTEEHQNTFEEIKKDISNSPVLIMPSNKGHLTLVSNTSKVACGAALYQEQRGKMSWLDASQRNYLPATIRYSVSELEFMWTGSQYE